MAYSIPEFRQSARAEFLASLMPCSELQLLATAEKRPFMSCDAANVRWLLKK